MERLNISGASDRSRGTPVHATCVVIGEAGVLILGQSGAGKTSLALGLLSVCVSDKCFSRLISDDLTLLRANGGRIIARPHPKIAGRYEMRGLGIQHMIYEGSAIVRLAVHCDMEDGPRYPELERQFWSHGGVCVPMIRVGKNHDRERLVLTMIHGIAPYDTHVTASGPRQFE